MSVPKAAWARRAARIHRATGKAADFVVTPAVGGSAVTYKNCKEAKRRLRRQDGNGTWVDHEATFIHVPSVSGATQPAEGAFGAYNGGRRFKIGAVRPKAGIWIVESLQQ